VNKKRSNRGQDQSRDCPANKGLPEWQGKHKEGNIFTKLWICDTEVGGICVEQPALPESGAGHSSEIEERKENSNQTNFSNWLNLGAISLEVIRFYCDGNINRALLISDVDI
jgi:hypothetical protein